MKQTVLVKVLPVALAIVGGLVFLLWWNSGSGRVVTERIKGQDRADGSGSSNALAGKWEGRLVPGSAVAPSGFTGVWPWFRGPKLNAVSTETVPLAKSWPEGGPKELWKIDVGEGFAAAI